MTTHLLHRDFLAIALDDLQIQPGEIHGQALGNILLDELARAVDEPVVGSA